MLVMLMIVVLVHGIPITPTLYLLVIYGDYQTVLLILLLDILVMDLK